jgi:hypothetical protein
MWHYLGCFQHVVDCPAAGTIWNNWKFRTAISICVELIEKSYQVFASFKPPTGSEQARHVRRGKGRVRTQDLGHWSRACYQLRYRPSREILPPCLVSNVVPGTAPVLRNHRYVYYKLLCSCRTAAGTHLQLHSYHCSTGTRHACAPNRLLFLLFSAAFTFFYSVSLPPPPPCQLVQRDTEICVDFCPSHPMQVTLS